MSPEDSDESSEAPALPQSQGALPWRGSCARRMTWSLWLWACLKRMEKQRGGKGAGRNQQKSKCFTNVFPQLLPCFVLFSCPEKYLHSQGAEIKNLCKLSVKLVPILMLLKEGPSPAATGWGHPRSHQEVAAQLPARTPQWRASGSQPKCLLVLVGLFWLFWGFFFSPEKFIWCIVHSGKICSVPTEVLFLPQQRLMVPGFFTWQLLHVLTFWPFNQIRSSQKRGKWGLCKPLLQAYTHKQTCGVCLAKIGFQKDLWPSL